MFTIRCDLHWKKINVIRKFMNKNARSVAHRRANACALWAIKPNFVDYLNRSVQTIHAKSKRK